MLLNKLLQWIYIVTDLQAVEMPYVTTSTHIFSNLEQGVWTHLLNQIG
jgi:hypothetical protein